MCPSPGWQTFVPLVARSAAGRSVSGLLLFVLFCLPGCSSLQKARQEQDLVESELRSQERHILELKSEIDRKEGTIHSLDLEVEKLQQANRNRPQQGEPVVPGVVKEIALGRLTGGYRSNPKSRFDDSLQFLIEPKDADGHAIKVPGSLHIELFEFLPSGVKTPLSAWDISQRELRRSWDQPLFGGPAYRILIPFKALPANEKMRVLVRFTTLDGKLFEAERDFTIRLPGPGGLPGAGPIMPMGAVPGGYSVVTPGHMINGQLVGPLVPPNGVGSSLANGMSSLPAPPGFEGTGRTGDLPGPPSAMPEKKLEFVKPAEQKPAEQKKDVIPMIPVEPRKTPSTLETPGNEPPPLPPAPDVPQFDASRKPTAYETLPAPSLLPRTAQPVYPREANVMQASAEVPANTSLDQPPPAAWRQKVNNGLIQVDYTSEAPIRLSRPIIVK